MPPRSIVDDLGFTVSLGREPQRVVSLVPSLTETLVLLDIGARLAGVTDYCIHPAAAVAALPRVGGTKNVDAAAVLALEPDLVIANAEENEKPVIEALKAVTAVFITYPRTVAGAIKTVEDLGMLTGLEEASACWAESCRFLLDRVRGTPDGRRIPAACLIWRDPWMAAGGDTYMSDLLAAFGFLNLFAGAARRYPVTSLAEIGSLGPEVILLPDEPYRFDANHSREIERALADAGHAPRIVLLDGTMLAWYGWRTRDALSYIAALRASLEPPA